MDSPLGSEDRADFDALLADLCEELRPRGFIEQTLVERIATCYWRLRRVHLFENGSIREGLESSDDNEDIDVLAYYEDQLRDEEKLLATMDRLAELLAKKFDELIQGEKEEIIELARQLPAPCPTSLLGMQPAIPEDVRTRLPETRSEQIQKVDRTREQLKQAHDEDELRRSRKSLMASLPEDGKLLKLIRYETMLDRQIYRSLNEFRRHRERGPLSENV
jgi:hypothetical protein